MSFKRLPKVGSCVAVRITYSGLAADADEFVGVLVRIKRIGESGLGCQGARWNRCISIGGCVQEAGVKEEIEGGVRDTKLHTEDDDVKVISIEEYERRKFAVQL